MRSPDTTVDIQGPPASSQESGRGIGIARGSFPRLPLRAQRPPFKPPGRSPSPTKPTTIVSLANLASPVRFVYPDNVFRRIPDTAGQTLWCDLQAFSRDQKVLPQAIRQDLESLVGSEAISESAESERSYRKGGAGQDSRAHQGHGGCRAKPLRRDWLERRRAQAGPQARPVQSCGRSTSHRRSLCPPFAPLSPILTATNYPPQTQNRPQLGPTEGPERAEAWRTIGSSTTFSLLMPRRPSPIRTWPYIGPLPVGSRLSSTDSPVLSSGSTQSSTNRCDISLLVWPLRRRRTLATRSIGPVGSMGRGMAPQTASHVLPRMDAACGTLG